MRSCSPVTESRSVCPQSQTPPESRSGSNYCAGVLDGGGSAVFAGGLEPDNGSRKMACEEAGSAEEDESPVRVGGVDDKAPAWAGPCAVMVGAPSFP